MDSPQEAISKYDSRFDAWWREVIRIGQFDPFTLPTDTPFAGIDCDGSFDAEMTPTEFLYDVLDAWAQDCEMEQDKAKRAALRKQMTALNKALG